MRQGYVYCVNEPRGCTSCYKKDELENLRSHENDRCKLRLQNSDRIRRKRRLSLSDSPVAPAREIVSKGKQPVGIVEAGYNNEDDDSFHPNDDAESEVDECESDHSSGSEEMRPVPPKNNSKKRKKKQPKRVPSSFRKPKTADRERKRLLAQKQGVVGLVSLAGKRKKGPTQPRAPSRTVVPVSKAAESDNVIDYDSTRAVSVLTEVKISELHPKHTGKSSIGPWWEAFTFYTADAEADLQGRLISAKGVCCCGASLTVVSKTSDGAQMRFNGTAGANHYRSCKQAQAMRAVATTTATENQDSEVSEEFKLTTTTQKEPFTARLMNQSSDASAVSVLKPSAGPVPKVPKRTRSRLAPVVLERDLFIRNLKQGCLRFVVEKSRSFLTLHDKGLEEIIQAFLSLNTFSGTAYTIADLLGSGKGKDNFQWPPAVKTVRGWVDEEYGNVVAKIKTLLASGKSLFCGDGYTAKNGNYYMLWLARHFDRDTWTLDRLFLDLVPQDIHNAETTSRGLECIVAEFFDSNTSTILGGVTDSGGDVKNAILGLEGSVIWVGCFVHKLHNALKATDKYILNHALEDVAGDFAGAVKSASMNALNTAVQKVKDLDALLNKGEGASMLKNQCQLLRKKDGAGGRDAKQCVDVCSDEVDGDSAECSSEASLDAAFAASKAVSMLRWIPTRFNSFGFTVRRMLELRPALNATIACLSNITDEERTRITLSATEWKILGFMSDILLEVNKWSKVLSSRASFGLGHVIPCKLELRKILDFYMKPCEVARSIGEHNMSVEEKRYLNAAKAASSHFDPTAVGAVKSFVSVLTREIMSQSRFGDVESIPVMCAAVVIDPRYSVNFTYSEDVDKCGRKFLSELATAAAIELGDKNDIPITNSRRKSDSKYCPSPEALSRMSSSRLRVKYLAETIDHSQSSEAKSTVAQGAKLSELLTALESKCCSSSKDPLQYFREHRSQFQPLWPLIERFSLLMASSIPSEWSIGAVKRILTPQRLAMTSETFARVSSLGLNIHLWHPDVQKELNEVQKSHDEAQSQGNDHLTQFRWRWTFLMRL